PLLWAITHNEREYPESLRSALYVAIDLVRKLTSEEVRRSQRVRQSQQRDDLYYALPLFGMPSYAAMKQYFAEEPEEPEGKEFRTLLGRYASLIYSVEGALPIGTHYTSFPFVLFRSYSLVDSRRKWFTERQLLNSSTLNVLNLILTR
nr:helicase [Ardenticatenales bacterium]